MLSIGFLALYLLIFLEYKRHVLSQFSSICLARLVFWESFRAFTIWLISAFRFLGIALCYFIFDSFANRLKFMHLSYIIHILVLSVNNSNVKYPYFTSYFGFDTSQNPCLNIDF